jgi:hypothetical protein
MVAPEVNNLRSLAAQYRSRAAQAEPDTAKILAEIAEELENEARKLDAQR